MARITYDQVIDAYTAQLAAKTRMVFEDSQQGETPEHAEERMDLIEAHNTLELQFMAQFG